MFITKLKRHLLRKLRKWFMVRIIATMVDVRPFPILFFLDPCTTCLLCVWSITEIAFPLRIKLWTWRRMAMKMKTILGTIPFGKLFVVIYGNGSHWNGGWRLIMLAFDQNLMPLNTEMSFRKSRTHRYSNEVTVVLGNRNLPK